MESTHTEEPRTQFEYTRNDIEEFGKAVEELRDYAYSSLSEQDLVHLKNVELRGRIATFLGYATAWLIPNPISAFLLSFGQSTRWMLAHHILHRGYDKVPGVPKKYTSKHFAMGWRRFIDWFDWIVPKAWIQEHNILHHYYTGENYDPDVLERNTHYLRDFPAPYFLKYLYVLFAGCTWKYTYYAEKTLSVIDDEESKPIKPKDIKYITLLNIFQLHKKKVRKHLLPLSLSLFLSFYLFIYFLLLMLFVE